MGQIKHEKVEQFDDVFFSFLLNCKQTIIILACLYVTSLLYLLTPSFFHSFLAYFLQEKIKSSVFFSF